MCYNYNKINCYKKNYKVQDQIETNNFFLNKTRLYSLDIDDD